MSVNPSPARLSLWSPLPPPRSPWAQSGWRCVRDRSRSTRKQPPVSSKHATGWERPPPMPQTPAASVGAAAVAAPGKCFFFKKYHHTPLCRGTKSHQRHSVLNCYSWVLISFIYQCPNYRPIIPNFLPSQESISINSLQLFLMAFCIRSQSSSSMIQRKRKEAGKCHIVRVDP